MTEKQIREGFHTVTPYLIVDEVDGLIEFVKQAFDATESQRMTGAAGGTHAEVRIGDSMVMIGGGGGERLAVMLYLYMEDVDAVYQHALDAGATSIMEPADQPDGERRAGVQDPFGNQWYIGAPN